ncbi:MAG: ChaN family lipoprotein, partial [Bacteroidales bacterium]|nr:ChaN family lipoprotein [Bacteroidales bacterium]
MKTKVLLIVLSLALMAMNGDLTPYEIFDNAGEKLQYKALLEEAENADIVFFGEQHNNPICHWLQLE